MIGVLGYLDPDVRHEFWATLRAGPAPCAPVLVEFMPWWHLSGYRRQRSRTLISALAPSRSESGGEPANATA